MATTTQAPPRGGDSRGQHRGTRARRAGYVRRSGRATPLTYVVLGAALILSAFPLYWTFVAASSGNEVIASTPPAFLPGGRFFDNVGRVFEIDTTDFRAALINSAIVSGTIAVSVVFFSSLAGFAFAKLRFRGRNVLLLVVIATMMIPVQLGIIPLYIIMDRLGWVNDLKAVIVPFLVNAFGVFFMRQYILQAVPNELIEAARVDGCNTWRIYRSVIWPAIRPAAGVLGLFMFMQYWNDFLWPLVVLSPTESPTVQVALGALSTSSYYQDYSLILAGTAIATLPLFIVFLLTGRQIISGIMEGMVKG